jgi:alanine dehydrogenase
VETFTCTLVRLLLSQHTDGGVGGGGVQQGGVGGVQHGGVGVVQQGGVGVQQAWAKAAVVAAPLSISRPKASRSPSRVERVVIAQPLPIAPR